MNPIRVLQARADARALLFKTAEYENLGEALTPLLVYAHESGLVDALGAATTWALIRKAFEGTAEV